jgi:hypothetical protein
VNSAGRPLQLAYVVVLAAVFAADPNSGQAAQATPQPSAQTPAEPSAAAADGPSTTAPRATAPNPSSAVAATETSGAAAASATVKAPNVASTPGKKVLVDDTVNDAQLKQILARGYKPEAQARGNEVYYCRDEHEVGTRFGKKVCKTATRILDDELQGKDETGRLERSTGQPAGK